MVRHCGWKGRERSVCCGLSGSNGGLCVSVVAAGTISKEEYHAFFRMLDALGSLDRGLAIAVGRSDYGGKPLVTKGTAATGAAAAATLPVLF